RPKLSTGLHGFHDLYPPKSQKMLVLIGFPSVKGHPAFAVTMNAPAIPLGKRRGPQAGLSLCKKLLTADFPIAFRHIITCCEHAEDHVVRRKPVGIFPD